jgi:hypothetical protein
MNAKTRWSLFGLAIALTVALLTMFAISKFREATFYPG